MQGRFTVMAAILALFSSGCTGLAEADGLLTAQDAVTMALTAHPSATLVGVYGVEGTGLRLQAPPRSVFVDDERDDGPLGDGRLSSWVVRLVEADRYSEVAVSFPDGVGERVTPAPPEFLLDSKVYLFGEPYLDSPEAAHVALADQCLSASASFGHVGYRYSFGLYDEIPAASHGFFAAPPEGHVFAAELGLSPRQAAWSVVALEMAEGTDHRFVAATLDQSGAFLSCHASRPVESMVRYDLNTWRQDIEVRPPWESSFEVHPRSQSIRIGLQVQGGGATDDANARILMPDGSVAFEGNAWRFQRMDIADPPAGSWLLQILPPDPLPRIGDGTLSPFSAQVILTVVGYERPGP